MKTYQLCVLIGLVLGVHSDPITPSPNKDDEELAKNYMKKLNMEEEKSSFGRKISEMSLKLGSNPEKPLGPEPTPPDTPNACDPNLVLDAVTTLRGEKIFFKDRVFWRVHPQFTSIEHYPIKYFWPELPDNIDAAFEDESADLVYIIKGQKVWALRAFDIEERLNLRSFKLPADVKRIDAALYDINSNRVLFIVGRSYYSYDIDKKVMDQGSPKPVEQIFPGMSEKVTAAFQEN
ncbi:collagenase 3-like, partial [Clarias magur]